MGLIADVGRLSSLVYAVAEGRGTWTDFVMETGRVFDTVHAVLTTQAPDRGTGMADGTAHVWARYDCGEYDGRDLLMERAWRLPRGKVSLVQSVEDDPRLTSSEFYQAFLAKSGLRHFVHVLLPEQPGSVAFFCLTRDAGQPEFSDEEVEAVEVLVSHLTRAVKQAARRGAGAPDTLFQGCGYGLVMFDDRGRVTQCNANARRLIDANDGMMLDADRLYVAGINGDFGSFASGRIQADGRLETMALEIERIGVELPLSGALSAVPAEWKDLGGGNARVMLVLTDPLRAQYPQAPTLVQHYGLTEREARFAEVLMETRALKQAGTQLGIAQETARRHLKSIFEKTRTHSQSELVHLLARHPATFLYQEARLPN